MIHDLKILPEYFEAVINNKKTFEIRKDDRNYKVGDCINLQEYNKEIGYTGESVVVRVLYKLNGGSYGLEKGYCILSIEII